MRTSPPGQRWADRTASLCSVSQLTRVLPLQPGGASRHTNLNTRLAHSLVPQGPHSSSNPRSHMPRLPANTPPDLARPPSPLPGGARGELTLGVSADESGEVSKECERGEVSQVSNLQGVQEGAQALSTEPEKPWGREREGSSNGWDSRHLFTWASSAAKLSPHCKHPQLPHSTSTRHPGLPLVCKFLSNKTHGHQSLCCAASVVGPTLRKNSHTLSQARTCTRIGLQKYQVVLQRSQPRADTARSTSDSDLTPDPVTSHRSGPEVPMAARAPEGLALDAHALSQAAQEGRRALLYHMLHAQPPLDVLQQPPQEAQEVLGSADGAWHGLCRETESAGTGRKACEGGGWGTAHPAAPRPAAQGSPGARLSPEPRWPPAAPPPGAGTRPAAAARLSP